MGPEYRGEKKTSENKQTLQKAEEKNFNLELISPEKICLKI